MSKSNSAAWEKAVKDPLTLQELTAAGLIDEAGPVEISEATSSLIAAGFHEPSGTTNEPDRLKDGRPNPLARPVSAEIPKIRGDHNDAASAGGSSSRSAKSCSASLGQQSSTLMEVKRENPAGQPQITTGRFNEGQIAMFRVSMTGKSFSPGYKY